MNFLDKFVTFISWQFSKVAQLALFAVMLVIASNVIIRYFWQPLPGTVEMVEILGAIIMGMGVAYCQQKKGHIFVSVIVDRFFKRTRAMIDTFTNTLAFLFSSVLAWQTINYGSRMMERGYTTGHLEIPIAPVIYLVGLGFTILAVVILRDLLAAFNIIIKEGGRK